MGTAMSEPPGQWVEPEVNYVDPERRFCAYCGRPIARRYWRATSVNGEEVAYCSPDHAARHENHPEQTGKSGSGTAKMGAAGA